MLINFEITLRVLKNQSIFSAPPFNRKILYFFILSERERAKENFAYLTFNLHLLGVFLFKNIINAHALLLNYKNYTFNIVLAKMIACMSK